MKKLLLGLVLLTGYHLRAADSQALQDEKAAQENFLQTITKFTREEVGIKKEDNGSVSLRFIASKNTIVVPADLVEQCSYLKDMFEIYSEDTEEEIIDMTLTAEAVNLLIALWNEAKTVEAFDQKMREDYSFAQLVDLWMAVETLGFDYDTKRSIVGPLQEKIGSYFLRLIGQDEPIDPILLGKIQVTMLRPYLTEQSYKNSWKLKNTLQGHAADVKSVAFSPDGSIVATASRDNTAKLWNTQTRQLLHTFQGHAADVNSVAFSPDGSTLVTGSADRTAKVWNAQTGQCLRTFQGHNGMVSSVIFSPNGQLIATASFDRTTKVWDVQTGQCLHTLQGHTLQITSVAFSPDGQLIVTGSHDATAKVWDVQTGKLLRTLQGHTKAIISVSFSLNRQLVATGSWDKTTKVWDAQTGQCLRTLQGDDCVLNSVAFSPDSQLIATGSLDNTAKLWNPETGQLLCTLQGHAATVTSAAFSPDGLLIATGSFDETAKVWIHNFAKAGIASLEQALQLSILDVLHVFKTGERPVSKIPAAESKPK